MLFIGLRQDIKLWTRVIVCEYGDTSSWWMYVCVIVVAVQVAPAAARRPHSAVLSPTSSSRREAITSSHNARSSRISSSDLVDSDLPSTNC